MKISENTVLDEVLALPALKGREYMADPGVGPLMKRLLGEEAYFSLLKGREFNQIPIREYTTLLPTWNVPSTVSALRFLVNKLEEGSVFYDFWDEEEKRVNPALGQTGLSAFPVPGSEFFVVICSGGGLNTVASIGEAIPMAMKLYEAGISAFVLEYRCGANARADQPEDDLGRAVRYILENRELFGVGEKYAVAGFSAGGYVAGLFGTEHLGYKKYGCPRPAAMVLSYPVITMGSWTHAMTRQNLLGEKSDDSRAQAYYSIEKHVSGNYPPVYMWQSEADDEVPVQNTQLLKEALEEAGVPCTYRTWPGTAHGTGIAEGTEAESWVSEAITFLEGVLQKS